MILFVVRIEALQQITFPMASRWKPVTVTALLLSLSHGHRSQGCSAKEQLTKRFAQIMPRCHEEGWLLLGRCAWHRPKQFRILKQQTHRKVAWKFQVSMGGEWAPQEWSKRITLKPDSVFFFGTICSSCMICLAEVSTWLPLSKHQKGLTCQNNFISISYQNCS